MHERTFFRRLYIILCNNTNYFAEVVAKKKVETLSTFEKQKNSLTNHIAKNLSYDTNKHYSNKQMQMKITHVINHSQYELNKYLGVP